MSKNSISFIIFLFILINCTGVPQKYYSYNFKNINSILVLPFETYSSNSKSPFYCPADFIIPGEIKSGAEEIMNNLLKNELSNLSDRYSFIFLSSIEYKSILAEILKNSENFKDIVKELAKKTNTNAILYGKIFRFKEREGSGFSIKEPASVAFVLTLYDGNSGQVLWRKIFDETQEPLSKNLFKLKLYGKIKWLTAKELAQQGIKNIFESFPK